MLAYTGGGATEAAAPVSAEEQATVGRRLAIGAVATVGLSAFALIPTKDLRVVKPKQPMFFYITQLLQAQVRMLTCTLVNVTWITYGFCVLRCLCCSVGVRMQRICFGWQLIIGAVVTNTIVSRLCA